MSFAGVRSEPWTPETNKYCTALRLYISPTSIKIAISIYEEPHGNNCELVVATSVEFGNRRLPGAVLKVL